MLYVKVESKDSVLKPHLEFGTTNFLHIKHQVKYELIETCSEVLNNDILKGVKYASVSFTLVDETVDIVETDQLSIGV